MRRNGLLSIIAVFACMFISAPSQAESLPLTEWRMQSSAALTAPSGETLSQPGVAVDSWHAVSVPSTVLAGLVRNGVYPDPYYGENLKAIPGYQEGLWLQQKEDSPFRAPWWHRTEFTLPESEAGRYFTLHFDGINYEANIWLNGKKIADRKDVIGMFRRFEFPVTEHLRFGATNVLAVEIIPPGLFEELKTKTKQIEATTGWDDHNPQPPDMNMGIWQPVYLKSQGAVSLRHPYVESELDLPTLKQARLTVSAWLHNNTDAPTTATLAGTIEERSFTQSVALEAGETREVFFRPEEFAPLAVEQPRVWWPHPVGAQELYELQLTVSAGGALSDAASTSFGIRDITTYINEDDWRGYQVNGRNILIRGGAWMTIDMLLNLDPALYDALVRHAREANFNMLRSEGFSIRETGQFYDLCDRYGVMVTQQIFGRSIPDEALAIACIEDTLLRIRNHPSLAHLLGHDETFPTDTLDAAYRELIEKHRIRRTYQPHSGTFNITSRAKTGGTRTGTRELWTYAGPSHYHFLEKRKGDSAWGFAQSGGIGGILASRDSLRQMMPTEGIWPVEDSSVWSFHTVLQGSSYFNAVYRMMDQQYGVPRDLDDFCNKLYAMNYNSARGMYEAYARYKYDALGITTWKYNAAWPAALTWQYVDWYKRATAAYYGAKKACTPVHVLYGYDDNSIHIVNSLYAPQHDVQLTWKVFNLDGTLVAEASSVHNVGEDGVVNAGTPEIDKAASDPCFLRLELNQADGTRLSDNTYWLSKTPDIPGRSRHGENDLFSVEPKSAANFTKLAELAPATVDAVLSRETGADADRYRVELRNTSNHVAFMVEADLIEPTSGMAAAPVYWSDNFLVLLPNESKTLTAETALAATSLQLRTRGYNVAVQITK